MRWSGVLGLADDEAEVARGHSAADGQFARFAEDLGEEAGRRGVVQRRRLRIEVAIVQTFEIEAMADADRLGVVPVTDVLIGLEGSDDVAAAGERENGQIVVLKDPRQVAPVVELGHQAAFADPIDRRRVNLDVTLFRDARENTVLLE